jgi:hypothetical protein
MPRASVMNIAWRDGQLLDNCSIRVGAHVRFEAMYRLAFPVGGLGGLAITVAR